MQWLQHVDESLFRLINHGLANPVFDRIMPLLSGNALFFPALVLLAAWLIWRGRSRGLLCLLMLVLAAGVADGLVSRTLKEAIGRPRPFLTLPDARSLIGHGGSGSMPSSHAANWFAALTVLFLYYRRAFWIALPVGVAVSFSRVYNGVHYPSDILAGALLGSGSAFAAVLLANTCWQAATSRWFPLWRQALPSLVPARSAAETGAEPEELAPPPKVRGQAPRGFQAPHVTADQHWLRLGYLLIAALLVIRWVYLASGAIQLSEDEAYQWLWSKHLDWSYYSKPPLIALTQFLGTQLWGDTAFGVRFFSPVISALIGALLLRFFAREVNARAGFFLLLILTATPMLSAGAVLMTIDPLSVLFWTAAMLAGWRAAREESTVTDWLWTGLWMGLGFLSKYTELFQLLCWVVFFSLWKPARRQLRRPGPWLALLLNLLLALPVVLWNARRDWVTVTHVADNAGAHQPWRPTLRYAGEFLGAELGLLNPVFFVAAVWAAAAFWRKSRRDPRLVYFFSMGAPLFLAYFAHSFRSRVLPNWIVPSVVPLFCLAVIYWDTRLRLGVAAVRAWLKAGLWLGLAVVVIGHKTELVARIIGRPVPVKYDPLHRVREWDQTARLIGEAREELLAEGKPVFIIANHYGITGETSFYLPAAKAAVTQTPLVYFRSNPEPENQFYFWPGYTHRRGENAIYVVELDRDDPQPAFVPYTVWSEFESVQPLGVRLVLYHGQLLRPLQFFACRNLK